MAMARPRLRQHSGSARDTEAPRARLIWRRRCLVSKGEGEGGGGAILIARCPRVPREHLHPRRPCPGRDTRRESRVRTPRGEGECAWGARARGCVAAAAAQPGAGCVRLRAGEGRGGAASLVGHGLAWRLGPEGELGRARELGRGGERTVGPQPTCAWAKRGGEGRLGLVRGMGLGEMAMTRWVACDGPGHELGWRVGGRGGGKGSWPTKIEKGFSIYDKGFEIRPREDLDGIRRKI